jgi:hypothetical protein
MASLIPALSLLHFLGAALGALGITLAEIRYLKATADGRIDEREHAHIRHTYWAMKWGLSLALVCGFLLTVAQYQLPANAQAVMHAALWFQDALALVVIFSGWALAARRLPWWLATALAFSAWWMMLFLHGWQTMPLSFATLSFLYVIFAGAAAIVLGYLRSVFHPDRANLAP